MEDFVVGSKELSIPSVWAILSQSYILKGKWSDFASHLRISFEHIEKLRLDLLHDKINWNDVLIKILHLWVADQASNTTLAELTRVIENECGDKCVAEKLRKNLREDSTNWAAFQQNVEQNVSKFCPQIPNGTKYCAMHDVWASLSKSGFIKQKWTDFAGFLRVPIEDIERLRQSLLLEKIELNYVLIQVLVLWVGYQGSNAQLEELIRVVEDECQDNSVGEKLRLAYNFPCKNFNDKTNWAALPPAFQVKVEKNISEYFPTIPLDTVKYKLEGNNLLDLMTGKKPKLFNSTIPPTPKFYLERTLLPRHTISEKIFDEDAPDIFLFTGLDEFELGRVIKANDTSTSDEQLDSSEVKVRFLILKMKHHFYKISNKVEAGTPVHQLSYEKNTGLFEWVRTNGRVDLLQRFIGERENPLSVEEFLSQLKNGMSGPILISDGPGMGKSFLLANIALRLVKREKIVILTSLNDFIKQVKVNSGQGKAKIDLIKDTLQAIICNGELGVLEFPSILSEPDIKIELLLDGFDEVSNYDFPLAIDTIKVLKEEYKSIRLWITTRPHHSQVLEAELGVLGYKIKGFDEDDQVKFLVLNWTHLKANQNENHFDIKKLEGFAHKVLRTTKSKLNNDNEDIAGAPLQCLLIGEVYEEDCFAFASGDGHSEYVPTIRINSIYDLYENMITRKFKKYIETHAAIEFAGMDNLINAHVDLSIKLLFPDYIPKLNYVQVSLQELLNIGIIQASSLTSSEFIHRTFAEYFVAGYVVDKLSSKGNIDSGFESFFLGEILTRKEYILKGLHGMEEIASYKFIHYIIVYFVNGCLSQAIASPRQAFLIGESTTRRELSHACANSSFLQILKLFPNLQCSDDTIILVATRNSTFEYFTFLFSYKEFVQFDDKRASNILRLSARRSEPSIVKYLLRRQQFGELIENLNDSTKLLLHDCVSNTKYKLEDDLIGNRKGVMRLLVEINPDLLEERDGCGRTPLLCEYVDANLLKELIELGADVGSEDIMGDTVLHLSKDQTRRLNAHEYHSLITRIPKSILAKVLKVAANDNLTPLMRLLCVIDPIKETLDILLKEGTGSVQVAFGIAIANGRNEETLKNLINFGVDCKWNGIGGGQSYLHVACYWSNLDALKLLVEYGLDPNLKDNLLRTPMDYIIESKKSNRFETAKALFNFGGRASEQYCIEQQQVLNKLMQDGNAQSVRIMKDILKFGSGDLEESRTITSSEGSQALHLSEEEFKLLVKDFATKNISTYANSDGKSLLHLAADRGDVLALKELVDNRADLDARDKNCNTPLHTACFYEDLTIALRMIKCLIESGADVYAKDDLNLTFLHVLVAASNTGQSDLHEIIEYLAEKNLLGLLLTTSGGPHGATPLQFACQQLELEEKTIMLLNKKGITFNELNENGENALTYAIMGGRTKTFLEMLINKYKADWKQQDRWGNNNLHVAAECGNLDALPLLMNLGLDINKANKFGATPLHSVSMFGRENILDVACMLLEAGVDVTKKTNEGQTALELALLRKYDSDKEFNSEIRNEFVRLLEIGNVDAKVHLSVTVRDDNLVGENQGLPPHQAIAETRNAYDCCKVIKSLLASGIDDLYAKDEEGYTFLHKFVTFYKPPPFHFHDVSKYLLNAGHKKLFEIKGGKENATVLHLTVKSFEPKLETLQLFKYHGINFNRTDVNGNSILAYAIGGKRRSEFLSLLVSDFGVRWGRLNNLGQNLLHISAQDGNEDALKLFMNLGIDINSIDCKGYSPLHFAVRQPTQNIPLIKCILDNGANVASLNFHNSSYIHLSAQFGGLQVLKLFLEKKVLDINAVDADGETPLHCSIWQEESDHVLEKVKLLLEYGADVNIKNKEGQTALDILGVRVTWEEKVKNKLRFLLLMSHAIIFWNQGNGKING